MVTKGASSVEDNHLRADTSLVAGTIKVLKERLMTTGYHWDLKHVRTRRYKDQDSVKVDMNHYKEQVATGVKFISFFHWVRGSLKAPERH